jgi:hypothetical protein
MRLPQIRFPFLLAVLLLSSSPARAQSCPSGSSLCGTAHCTPDDGGVCCADVGHEELNCPTGTTCTGDGGCSGTPTPSCSGGGDLTVASCGGDSCSCSAPCATSDDCESGCCTTIGFCAPQCVCTTTSARLFLQCDTTSAGGLGLAPSGGKTKSGCAFSPTPTPLSTYLLLAVAFVVSVLAASSLRRRRR